MHGICEHCESTSELYEISSHGHTALLCDTCADIPARVRMQRQDEIPRQSGVHAIVATFQS